MDKQIVGLEITTEILIGETDNFKANELLKKIEDRMIEIIEKEFGSHVISGKGKFMYLGDKIKRTMV